MRTIRLVLIAAGTLLLEGCATAALINSPEPFRVTRVNVTRAAQNVGTVNLVEDVRVKVLRRAPQYASVGRSKTVDIRIASINFKNPVQSLLIGDTNRLIATTTVVDDATGTKDAAFDTIVIDDTGLQGISGAVLSAIDNPIDIEQRLADALAQRILTQIYGSQATLAAAARPQDSNVRANYPKTYEGLRVEHGCAAQAAAAPMSHAFRGDSGTTATKPPTKSSPAPECREFAAAEPQRPVARQ